MIQLDTTKRAARMITAGRFEDIFAGCNPRVRQVD